MLSLTSRFRVALPFCALSLLLGCGGTEDAPAEVAEPSAEITQTQPTSPDTEYTNITVDEMEQLLEDGDNYLVMNVHVPDAGEIPGTDVHIPFNEIEAHEAELPAARDAPIVVYCRSGNMSQTASETLASMGYTNILHLEGGMNAWEEAGHSLQVTGEAR